MSTNPSKTRAKSRTGQHTNSLMTNNKSQMRHKSTAERPVTPEGVYYNARLMHCTTSLVGCVVQIQTKDGTQYEGVLRTFSPEFELVIDYVTKMEANSVPIVGSNIANLLASLQANNAVSQRIIFKFQDVVKLNVINVDLDFAASKGHMLTDTEISRFDANKVIRDKDLKELVPWDGGHGDESLEALEDHNGISAQNGWSAEDMFQMNKTKFHVQSTYDPALPDYTCPLPQGEGPEYERRQREAKTLADEITNESKTREDPDTKEDVDDEEGKFSAVQRNTESRNHDKGRNRKSNTSPNSALNHTGMQNVPSGQMRQVSSSAPMNAFHGQKAGSNYNKSNQQTNRNVGVYQNPSHRNREEPFSGSQAYPKNVENEEPSYAHRNSNDNRRTPAVNKSRKDDMSTDPKKTSHDHKVSPNADASKERENTLKSESSVKNVPSGGSSAKSKSPLNVADATPVKEKTADNLGSQLAEESVQDTENADQAETRDQSESGTAQTAIDSSADTEIAKKSTLNPNAKTFTPRSPLAPLNTSATPPSVPSTPSSTVSVPISGNHLTHSSPQNLSQGHHQIQVGPQQSASHTSQARFQIPIVHQNQFNVLTPSLPLLPNQPYLMTNVMAPFAQSNPNQQRTFGRGKGQAGPYRHEFNQSHPVAAAVTGHPVLATAPIGAPQQIPVSYGPQQTTAMVAPQGPPQPMYQHMYQYPRMNVLPQHSTPMQMAVQQAVQYDPTQLQHIYTGTVNAVQLQHLVSQAHQHQQAHLTNSGPHSGHSTPQSATPTTPLHGGPAPSPVHHQPNQPPTPTPPQPVMYANVTTAHNPQNANVGHHSNSGTYPSILLMQPTGHHSGHGAPLHPSHPLSHNSTATNHSGPAMIAPVHMISPQNQLAATFNANPGV